MRTFGKWLGRLLLVLVVLGGAVWVFGPREDTTMDFSFDPADFGADLDAYFAAQEAQFDDITPGTEKRILWADTPGASTPISLVYLHGFSASAQEMRPVPSRLADALGANLVFTRLTGHGSSGMALAQATPADWARDTAEAIHAARAIGDRVVILSLSTGGTLAAAAAMQPDLMEQVAGIVFVSPNFALNTDVEPLLTWPAARYWLPLLAGQNRDWEAANDEQKIYWTTSYPSVAVLPMAAMVKEVAAADYSGVDIPALFYLSPDDQVVRADISAQIADAWGGEVQLHTPTLTDDDDAFSHNVVGEILSPNQTEPALAVMLPWIKALP